MKNIKIIYLVFLLGASNFDLRPAAVLIEEPKAEAKKEDSKFIAILKKHKKALGISAAALATIAALIILGVYKKEKIQSALESMKEEKKFFIGGQRISEAEYNRIVKQKEQQRLKKEADEKVKKDLALKLEKEKAEACRVVQEKDYQQKLAEWKTKQAQAEAERNEQLRKQEEARIAALREKEIIRQKFEQERLALESAKQERLAREQIERELAQKEQDRTAREREEKLAKQTQETQEKAAKEYTQREKNLEELYKNLHLIDTEYENLRTQRDKITGEDLLRNPGLGSKIFDLTQSIFESAERLGEVKRKIWHENKALEELRSKFTIELRTKKEKEAQKRYKRAQREEQVLRAELKKKSDFEAAQKAQDKARYEEQKRIEEEAKKHAEAKKMESAALQKAAEKANIEPSSRYIKAIKKREKRKLKKQVIPEVKISEEPVVLTLEQIEIEPIELQGQQKVAKDVEGTLRTIDEIKSDLALSKERYSKLVHDSQNIRNALDIFSKLPKNEANEKRIKDLNNQLGTLTSDIEVSLQNIKSLNEEKMQLEY